MRLVDTFYPNTLSDLITGRQENGVWSVSLTSFGRVILLVCYRFPTDPRKPLIVPVGFARRMGGSQYARAIIRYYRESPWRIPLVRDILSLSLRKNGDGYGVYNYH